MFKLVYTVGLLVAGAAGALAIPEPERVEPPKAVAGVQESVPSRLQRNIVHIEDHLGNQGSGMLFRGSDGRHYCWTCAHVIEDARLARNSFRQVQVRLDNRSTTAATVLRYSAGLDLALLRVEQEGLPYEGLRFRTEPHPALGSPVYIAGCPLGSEGQGTVTAGIISYIGRRFPDSQRVQNQTTATTLPGTSGSPLALQADGEVIGIVRATYTRPVAGRGLHVETMGLYVPVEQLVDYARRTGVVWAVDPARQVTENGTIE
jgi:S1-C subfamily serine protease